MSDIKFDAMKPEEIAAQLRCPNGDQAGDVAQRMNHANQSANLACLELLQVATGDRVLEIGPGNGAFAGEIVAGAAQVAYTGLDWSADMIGEARKLNRALVQQGQAAFLQGSSDALPFQRASFDKVLSVHTLYFWEYPERHLDEIRRVMKPGGRFCLAFADRTFMQALPFVAHGFTLYDFPHAERLLRASGFDILAERQLQDTGHSNTGDVVDKVINIIVATVPA